MINKKALSQILKAEGLTRTASRYDRYEADRRWKAERMRSLAKEALFGFRTPGMQRLWDEELTGQISDGRWENTPNSGWQFWCNVPTARAPKTQFKGWVPSMIKQSFDFPALMEWTGEEMLETVREVEPDATLSDVMVYLEEIRNAMRAAAKGEEAAQGGSEQPEEVDQDALRVAVIQARQAISQFAGGLIKKVAGQAIMVGKPGTRRANKYHYFLVAKVDGIGRRKWEVFTCYGTFGKKPKVVPIGTFNSEADAVKAAFTKAKAKKKDYVRVLADQIPSNEKMFRNL